MLECKNNFEKLIVSVNTFVDYQLAIAFLLLVLITFLANRAQTYYERKTIHCLKIQE